MSRREVSFQSRGRLDAVLVLFSLAVGVLFLRLFQLQILDWANLTAAAERNRTEMIYQTAPRGFIYDRNGAVLATNRPMFSLIYLPSHKKLEDLRPLAQELAAQLRRDPRDILASLEEATQEDSVVRLAENLPPRVMFRLSELKPVYPGVDLVMEAERYYPLGDFASHLIGYVGRMDPRDWLKLRSEGYRLDSPVGRMGIEKVFESVLRGRDGAIRMEVDAQGRLKRQLDRIPWQPGDSLTLTVNASIQEVAESALRRTISGRGAAVVLDPRNGAVLALASTPDFNLNELAASAPPGERPANPADLPEFDRAISGTYAPGSTFKIVVGAAGLNEGRFTVNDTVFCPGYFKLGRRIFKCWTWDLYHRGHGVVNWWTGFAQSCDVYFYEMGLRTGGALIEKYAGLFGLGRLTRITLPGESPGHLFGPKTLASEGRPWYDGDTVNLSIGQGGMLVTPIQMAVLISAVANGGTLWRPHYVERVHYADGGPDYVQQPEKTGEVVLKPAVWQDLRQALRLVVTSGTAHGANIAGLDVRGKTGTAQNSAGRAHSWFVAYAGPPGQPPSVAVAVLVENGGESWVYAVPIARDIFKAAFGIGKPPPWASLGLRSKPAAAPPNRDIGGGRA
ncbi:MAG TPA: penicillin-binding protein 2 [Elusimicrobiota bacterium]|nr:penicillin-binding protein 2 [Elusimicrobiota bacterium]